jgi:hypothetical protein
MSDCELPQYYVCKEVVGRKQHECCECIAPIEIGEKHLLVSACWDGLPGRYRQHLLCQEACELVRDSGMNDDECLAFGELDEFWRSDRPPYCEPELPSRRKLWRLMLRITRRERKERSR